MKFAVVEYTSKSGRIWKHTTERPNYVADPIHEIDPTSFGCYVSALAGEHIPLVSLIVGPTNPVSLPRKVWRKGVKRFTGQWPSAYSLEYLAQFSALLIVHQLSDTHELVTFLHRLRSELPHLKRIGVPTQPYGILRQRTDTDPSTRQQLVAFMDACDAFLTLSESTRTWYASLSATPVHYLPQPYPVTYARTQFVPRPQKAKQILVAGVTQRNNIIQGQQIAHALQAKHPDYEIIIPKVGDLEYDTSELAGARYRLMPFEQWRQHLTTLASSYLVINTDYTHTRGRVTVDSAVVGTPSLGGNSDAQVDLFPALATTPTTSTEEIIKLGEKLLSDAEYYDAIVNQAQPTLDTYAYEPAAARLTTLINSLS